MARLWQDSTSCNHTVYTQGSAALVADVIENGQSLLLLGRPGVGYVTL